MARKCGRCNADLPDGYTRTSCAACLAKVGECCRKAYHRKLGRVPPPRKQPPAIPIAWILEAGCIATGTTPERILSRDRSALMSRRRRFIARKMRCAGYPYEAIGRALNRSHHTIMAILGVTTNLLLKGRKWRAA